MDRESYLYKFRRSIQRIIYKLLSKEFLSKFYYRIVMKEKLQLKEPKTFNEKLQYLKLFHFPKNELAVKCTDKVKVREYIASKGLERYLHKFLGVWFKGADIDFSALPNQFVLKTNHGCAYNIICKNKTEFNIKSNVKKLNRWLKEDFGAFNLETHYSSIKPRMILAEEYLGDNLVDYKFFCFNGNPEFLYVSRDLINDREAEIGFFGLDGKKIGLIREDYKTIDTVTFPKFYNEMLDVAKKLSEDFVFVRVDFFVLDNRFYFSELTFTPGAAMMPLNPKKFDYEWGNLLNIDEVMK